MTRLNKNPLVPFSWQAGGSKGEAKAQRPCEEQDIALTQGAHYLARAAVDAAREQMHALALATDEPLPGVVEAADLLDAAADSLAQLSDFSDTIKDSKGGTA